MLNFKLLHLLHLKSMLHMRLSIMGLRRRSKTNRTLRRRYPRRRSKTLRSLRRQPQFKMRANKHASGRRHRRINASNERRRMDHFADTMHTIR